MIESIDKRIINKGFHTGYEVDFVAIQQSDYEYLKEQAERVEELEKANKEIYWIASDFKFENLKLVEQNKRYREAIEKAIGGCRYTNPEVAYILGQALEGEE